ncbi:MAG: hypothetical protein ARM1_0549 [Candidatus Micrarchaeota archaeon]|nr:MAG: hypothetical protein ARM1_0549 [Candidatus Micrarchaeota archaeon]
MVETTINDIEMYLKYVVSNLDMKRKNDRKLLKDIALRAVEKHMTPLQYAVLNKAKDIDNEKERNNVIDILLKGAGEPEIIEKVFKEFRPLRGYQLIIMSAKLKEMGAKARYPEEIKNIDNLRAEIKEKFFEGMPRLRNFKRLHLTSLIRTAKSTIPMLRRNITRSLNKAKSLKEAIKNRLDNYKKSMKGYDLIKMSVELKKMKKELSEYGGDKEYKSLIDEIDKLRKDIRKEFFRIRPNKDKVIKFRENLDKIRKSVGDATDILKQLRNAS